MNTEIEKDTEGGLKRVCMIVRNAVTQDARVMKEAGSVAAAGYDVMVVGLREKVSDKPEELLEERLRILRVPFFVYARRVKRIRLALVLLLALALLYWLVVGLAAGQWQSVVVALLALVFLMSLVVAYWRRRPGKLNENQVAAPDRNWAATGQGNSGRKPAGRLLISLGRIAGRAQNTLKTLVGVTLTNRTMLQAIIAMRPDIVHCHDIGTLRLGIAAKRRLKCRLVYDAHEIYDEAVGIEEIMRRLYRFIHRRAQNKVDRFITINDSIAEYYATHYPRLPKAVVVMNATRISDGESYDGRLHRAAGLPPEQRVLLFQGGFTAKRGISATAESAEFLPENWSVVFMGSGSLEPLIRQQAERIGAEAGVPRLAVIPPAPQEELTAWTAGATIGVIPYEDHGLNHVLCTPNKLWEFPNAGVPTLVTPRVEMKKMIERYRYGWVLQEPVTGQGIGRFIGSLTETDLENAKHACRDFIDACHWGIFERRLIALYKDLSTETI